MSATDPISGPQPLAPELGARLRQLRGDKLQREIADLAGWHLAKLSKIESGQLLPSEDDLRVLLAALGASSEAARDVLTLRDNVNMFRLVASRQTRSSMFEYEGDSPLIRGGQVVVESGTEPGRAVIVRFREDVEKEIASVLDGATRRMIAYQGLRIGALVFSAVTPTLAALRAPAYLTTVVGFAALMCTGVIQLTKLNDRALVDQERASALHRQVRLYRTGVGDYAAEGRDALLVERVEAIRERADRERIAVVRESFEYPTAGHSKGVTG